MAYGRITTGSSDYGRLNTSQPKYGRLNNRGITETNKRIFNSLPGEVIRVLGTFLGEGECVGGSREVVTDIPTGLFNYASKLAMINSNIPEEGSVAVMPAGEPGHLGVVISSDGEFVYMYDVNADGKNTQMIRKVPIKNIDGYYKGNPSNIKTDRIAKAKEYISTPIAPKEEKLIAQAEKESVKFNAARVIDEMKTEMPDMATELGGLQSDMNKAADDPTFMEKLKTRYDKGDFFNDPAFAKNSPPMDIFLGFLKTMNKHTEGYSELGQKGLRATTALMADKLGFKEAAETLKNNDIGKINPMIEKAMGITPGRLTTTANGWQVTGGILETLAEFYIGGSKAIQVEKALTSLPAMMNLPKYLKGAAQLATIVGIESSTSAAITAGQEGEVIDPETGKVNSAVKWSAIIGGAFPLAKGVMQGVKGLVTSSPEALLQQALKPNKKDAEALKQNAPVVMKYIQEKYPNISNIDELSEAIQSEAKNVWAIVEKGMKKTGEKAAVNGNTIRDYIINEFKKETKLLRENPNLMDDYVIPFANKYKGLIKVDDSGAILKDTNVLLKQMYNQLVRSGIGDAFSTSVQTKIQKFLAEGLRKGIDDAVNVAGESAVTPFRQLYGKLSQVGGLVGDKALTMENLAPLNLQQTLNIPQGIANFGKNVATGNFGKAIGEGATQILAAQGAKAINAPNKLIQTAFEKMGSKPGLLGNFGNILSSGSKAFNTVFSPDSRNERNELEFDKIQLPTASASQSQPTAQAKSGSLQSIINSFIPSTYASPNIPPKTAPKPPIIPQQATQVPQTPQTPVRPPIVPQIQPSQAPAKTLYDTFAPQGVKSTVGALQGIASKVSPALLDKNAPPPPKPTGLDAIANMYTNDLEGRLSEYNRTQNPPSKKSLLDIIKSSPIGKVGGLLGF